MCPLSPIPARFGRTRTFATLALLAVTLWLGLLRSNRSARTCQMTDLSTFSARFTRVGTICGRVLRVSTSRTCMLCLIVAFSTTFCSLAILTRLALSHSSNVHCGRLRLSSRNCSRNRGFFKVSTRISKWVFNCDSGSLTKNVPILISSSKTLTLSRS